MVVVEESPNLLPSTDTSFSCIGVRNGRLDQPKRGALFNLGRDIARNKISTILKQRGVKPAHERRHHATWHPFIESHLGAIAGADFITLEVLRGFGLA